MKKSNLKQNKSFAGTSHRPPLIHRLSFRLWGIMMVLVILAAFFIGTAQIFLFDKFYIRCSANEITNKVGQMCEMLEDSDLAEHTGLLSTISVAVSGKVLLISEDNKVVEAYSSGYPIAIGTHCSANTLWSTLQRSSYFKFIVNRENFHELQGFGKGNAWLYIGIPVKNNDTSSYVIIIHSFSDVYSMLAVNRIQFAILCVLLTIVASALAAFLSRRFTKPILEIKATVNSLADGNLDAVPNVNRTDELGQLSCSVKELGIALKRVDVLRKEVIANVSHELRTPLAHIGGYAEMARDVHYTDSGKYTEDLDFIISETTRMAEMVSDIMDYSQLQSGYMPLKKEQYNLYEIIETEYLNCEKAARNNHLELKYEYDCTDYPVCLDALKITQVIRNLIYNAINHTANGETIYVKSLQTEKGILVSIENPGNPIPEEERAIIWERYQRSQHQAGRQQGTGIGLSIVASILDAHGMTYGVDCKDGFTIFWFCI